MTDGRKSSIESARSRARGIAHEELSSLREVEGPSTGMYEYDAVYTDDESCGVLSVSIMVDEDAGTFALVENPVPMAKKLGECTRRSNPKADLSAIDWNELAEEHAVAYLRGDLATSSPESYSLEEMRAISEGMDESTAKVEAVMRADFERLPPEGQGRMLDLLKRADPDNYHWWFELLCGEN